MNETILYLNIMETFPFPVLSLLLLSQQKLSRLSDYTKRDTESLIKMHKNENEIIKHFVLQQKLIIYNTYICIGICMYICTNVNANALCKLIAYTPHCAVAEGKGKCHS